MGTKTEDETKGLQASVVQAHVAQIAFLESICLRQVCDVASATHVLLIFLFGVGLLFRVSEQTGDFRQNAYLIICMRVLSSHRESLCLGKYLLGRCVTDIL